MFINLAIICTKTYAKVFKIENVEITQPYNLYFKKENVIDKAIIESFNILVQRVIKSEDYNKIDVKNINEIKPMLDSFSIVDERFKDNNYSANFSILFNKRDILTFLNKKNIVSSSPIKKKIFFLPIFIDLKNNELSLYNQNRFYIDWNLEQKKTNLLSYYMPGEDLDDYNFIKNNLDNIENFDFNNILSKYNAKEYIVSIFFKDQEKIKVLSRISLNNEFFISNLNFNNIKDINDQNSKNIISNLKVYYENEWKRVNEINTSIKLPLTITINSKKIDLINKFESELISSDLIYDYSIDSINSDENIYKLIYNGTPDKFLSEFKNKKFKIDISNEIWLLNE